MQASAYAAEAVARLADRRSRDAVLWRAYGLIKNGAFERALTVLDHLEEDDGYAAVYRLFCHEALGDEEAAAAWYQKALASDDAPRRYLDHLTAFYYRSKNDREMHETFDWPAGEVLDVGWFREAKGTNITIRATGEALAFQGVQTASREPISRAWCVRPRDHVRRVAATVHAGETQGAVGLELLDETRSNGLAVAVIDGGALHWRRLRDGVWETWEQLLTSPPTTWAVWIDPQQEGEKQVQLMTTREHIPMTSLFDLPGGMLCIGFFVEAPAGAVVDATVDDLRIQLHREQPADGQQAPAEGAAPGASRGRR